MMEHFYTYSIKVERTKTLSRQYWTRRIAQGGPTCQIQRFDEKGVRIEDPFFYRRKIFPPKS